MEVQEKRDGYPQKDWNKPTKRYCQTMDLKDYPDLINEYIKRHSAQYHWPEIRAGIKAVGIMEMEIYLVGTKLFMIVETSLDFEWEAAMNKLASLPRQAEWEEYMSLFQDTSSSIAAEKWQLMDRVFYLYD